MYWVQFEGYISSRPELKHNYKDPIVSFAGRDWHVRPRFGSNDDTVPEGSDTAHVRRLIATRGFKMPAGMVNVRLVHLVDPGMRRELMIIYAEDVALNGVAEWQDLLPGRAAAERWPELQAAVLQHAEERLRITR